MITAEAPANFNLRKKSSASSKGCRGERQITVKIPRDESCSNARIRESTLHGGGGRPGSRSRSPSIEIWTLNLQLRDSSSMRSASSNIVEECVCRMISSGGVIRIACSTFRVIRYFFSAGCQGSVELDMKMEKGMDCLCAQDFSLSTVLEYKSLVLTSTKLPHSRPRVIQVLKRT